MVEQLSFSTDGLSADEAFLRYARLYAHGSDVRRGEGGFRADIRGWRLDGVLLFERRLTGVVHSRQARAGRDGMNHLVITAVLDGWLIGSPESGFQRAGAGEIVLADSARPSRTEPREAHLLTASVSREIVEAAMGGMSGLHGRILQPPSNGMLMDFMRSLARHGDQLDVETLPNLSRAFIDVLASAGDPRFRASGEARRQDWLRRQAVEQCIAEGLADPALSVNRIAVATGLSRSALYRLFGSEGGVARLIRQRRLEAVRRVLDEGQAADLFDLARDFGFSSETRLARQFADRYGQSPTAYRAVVVAEGRVADAGRRWVGWMGEVS